MSEKTPILQVCRLRSLPQPAVGCPLEKRPETVDRPLMAECDLLYVVRSALQTARQSSKGFLVQLGILGEEPIRLDRTVIRRGCTVPQEQDAVHQVGGAARCVTR